MAKRRYWLNLCTAKSWEESRTRGYTCSGWNESRWKAVQKMQQGDYLLLYMSGVSRFIGVLEVASKPFRSEERIWDDALYPCRVEAKPVVMLEPDTAVPIHDLKDKLSIFRDMESPKAWIGRVRGSPQEWSAEDGETILRALMEAKEHPVVREVDPRKLAYRPPALKSKIGAVTVPDSEPEEPESSVPPKEPTEDTAVSEHTRIQSMLVTLGGEMGLDVWIASNDRGRVVGGKRLGELPRVIDDLPLQFDAATMKTVKLIDVLWLRRRTIEAAFEIECTTSIYSGLLRMSDLISMQPNLNIPLYIVAPDERRAKVIEEVNRATFTRLSPPMPEICSFIALSALEEAMRHPPDLRRHLKPDYLEELSESCEVEEA